MEDPLLNELQLFSKDLSELHIAVIGDVMIDRYIYGTVSRISPEAPVPVVLQHRTQNHLGGAANVVTNLKALGVRTVLFGVTGIDADAQVLENLLHEEGMEFISLIKDPTRPTTVKTRIMSQGHQLLRIDQEVELPIPESVEIELIKKFQDFARSHTLQMVILEDYNKGVFTKSMIQSIIAFCRSNHIKIAVDPKKDNFFEFKNVDLFKPNIKEAIQALGISNDSISNMYDIGNQLIEKLNCQKLIITMAGDGLWIQDRDLGEKHATQTRTVADVSGAGDTVISVAAVCTVLSLSKSATALLCNTGGGQVCEKTGVVPVNKGKLMAEVMENLPKKGNLDQA